MKKALLALTCAAATMISTGCAYLGGGTNLEQVASASGLTNVTTGDGTFENYQATGYYTGTEIGIAVGIPFLLKLVELYPVQSNEDLMIHIANAAKADGATAMINATPHTEWYSGIPFFIVGLYIDGTSGTGIRVK